MQNDEAWRQQATKKDFNPLAHILRAGEEIIPHGAQVISRLLVSETGISQREREA